MSDAWLMDEFGDGSDLPPDFGAPKLLGVSGYATAGKDTTADLLGVYGYRKVAFADTMRAATEAINPIVGRRRFRPIRYNEAVALHGYDGAKANYPEVRRFLQRFGTDFGRKLVGTDFWVNLALDRLAEPGGRYVFADVRFPNEAHAIQARGGMVIRVSRPGVGPANDHESEVSLDDYPFDFTVFNDGSLDDLREQVAVLLDVIERSAP